MRLAVFQAAACLLTPGAGAQERPLAEQRRDVAAVVDDIFIAFDIEMRGREPIEGHDAIVLSLTPRPGAKPRTDEGRQLQTLACRAWVSESDYELVPATQGAMTNATGTQTLNRHCSLKAGREVLC